MKARQARKIFRRYCWPNAYRASTVEEAKKRLRKLPAYKDLLALVSCLEAGYKISIPTVGRPLIIEDIGVCMMNVTFNSELINFKEEKTND
jgi:hypothetical protein